MEEIISVWEKYVIKSKNSRSSSVFDNLEEKGYPSIRFLVITNEHLKSIQQMMKKNSIDECFISYFDFIFINDPLILSFDRFLEKIFIEPDLSFQYNIYNEFFFSTLIKLCISLLEMIIINDKLDIESNSYMIRLLKVFKSCDKCPYPIKNDVSSVISYYLSEIWKNLKNKSIDFHGFNNSILWNFCDEIVHRPYTKNVKHHVLYVLYVIDYLNNLFEREYNQLSEKTILDAMSLSLNSFTVYYQDNVYSNPLVIDGIIQLIYRIMSIDPSITSERTLLNGTIFLLFKFVLIGHRALLDELKPSFIHNFLVWLTFGLAMDPESIKSEVYTKDEISEFHLIKTDQLYETNILESSYVFHFCDVNDYSPFSIPDFNQNMPIFDIISSLFLKYEKKDYFIQLIELSKVYLSEMLNDHITEFYLYSYVLNHIIYNIVLSSNFYDSEILSFLFYCITKYNFCIEICLASNDNENRQRIFHLYRYNNYSLLCSISSKGYQCFEHLGDLIHQSPLPPLYFYDFFKYLSCSNNTDFFAKSVSLGIWDEFFEYVSRIPPLLSKQNNLILLPKVYSFSASIIIHHTQPNYSSCNILLSNSSLLELLYRSQLPCFSSEIIFKCFKTISKLDIRSVANMMAVYLDNLLECNSDIDRYILQNLEIIEMGSKSMIEVYFSNNLYTKLIRHFSCGDFHNQNTVNVFICFHLQILKRVKLVLGNPITNILEKDTFEQSQSIFHKYDITLDCMETMHNSIILEDNYYCHPIFFDFELIEYVFELSKISNHHDITLNFLFNTIQYYEYNCNFLAHSKVLNSIFQDVFTKSNRMMDIICRTLVVSPKREHIISLINSHLLTMLDDPKPGIELLNDIINRSESISYPKSFYFCRKNNGLDLTNYCEISKLIDLNILMKFKIGYCFDHLDSSREVLQLISSSFTICISVTKSKGCLYINCENGSIKKSFLVKSSDNFSLTLGFRGDNKCHIYINQEFFTYDCIIPKNSQKYSIGIMENSKTSQYIIPIHFYGIVFGHSLSDRIISRFMGLSPCQIEDFYYETLMNSTTILFAGLPIMNNVGYMKNCVNDTIIPISSDIIVDNPYNSLHEVIYHSGNVFLFSQYFPYIKKFTQDVTQLFFAFIMNCYRKFLRPNSINLNHFSCYNGFVFMRNLLNVFPIEKMSSFSISSFYQIFEVFEGSRADRYKMISGFWLDISVHEKIPISTFVELSSSICKIIDTEVANNTLEGFKSCFISVFDYVILSQKLYLNENRNFEERKEYWKFIDSLSSIKYSFDDHISIAEYRRCSKENNISDLIHFSHDSLRFLSKNVERYNFLSLSPFCFRIIDIHSDDLICGSYIAKNSLLSMNMCFVNEIYSVIMLRTNMKEPVKNRIKSIMVYYASQNIESDISGNNASLEIMMGKNFLQIWERYPHFIEVSYCYFFFVLYHFSPETIVSILSSLIDDIEDIDSFSKAILQIPHLYIWVFGLILYHPRNYNIMQCFYHLFALIIRFSGFKDSYNAFLFFFIYVCNLYITHDDQPILRLLYSFDLIKKSKSINIISNNWIEEVYSLFEKYPQTFSHDTYIRPLGKLFNSIFIQNTADLFINSLNQEQHFFFANCFQKLFRDCNIFIQDMIPQLFREFEAMIPTHDQYLYITYINRFKSNINCLKLQTISTYKSLFIETIINFQLVRSHQKYREKYINTPVNDPFLPLTYQMDLKESQVAFINDFSFDHSISDSDYNSFIFNDEGFVKSHLFINQSKLYCRYYDKNMGFIAIVKDIEAINEILIDQTAKLMRIIMNNSVSYLFQEMDGFPLSFIFSKSEEKSNLIICKIMDKASLYSPKSTINTTAGTSYFNITYQIEKKINYSFSSQDIVKNRATFLFNNKLGIIHTKGVDIINISKSQSNINEIRSIPLLNTNNSILYVDLNVLLKISNSSNQMIEYDLNKPTKNQISSKKLLYTVIKAVKFHHMLFILYDNCSLACYDIETKTQKFINTNDAGIAIDFDINFHSKLILSLYQRNIVSVHSTTTGERIGLIYLSQVENANSIYSVSYCEFVICGERDIYLYNVKGELICKKNVGPCSLFTPIITSGSGLLYGAIVIRENILVLINLTKTDLPLILEKELTHAVQDLVFNSETKTLIIVYNQKIEFLNVSF